MLRNNRATVANILVKGVSRARSGKQAFEAQASRHITSNPITP